MNNYTRDLIVLFIVLLTCTVLADTRSRIVVMDTGIRIDEYSRPYLCDDGHIDFTGAGLYDFEGHGTNVAGLIAKHINNKTHCLLIYKYYHTVENPTNDKKVGDILIPAWDALLTSGAKYVNMSFEGDGYTRYEYYTIKKLTEKGVKIIVAAGNENIDLSKKCETYPACYKIEKNLFVVTANDLPGIANFGGPVSNSAPGRNQRGKFGPMLSGTSQACANYTGQLAGSK